MLCRVFFFLLCPRLPVCTNFPQRVVTGASRYAEQAPPPPPLVAQPRPLKRRRTEVSKSLSRSGGGSSTEPVLLDIDDDDVRDAFSRCGDQSGVDASARDGDDGGGGGGRGDGGGSGGGGDGGGSGGGEVGRRAGGETKPTAFEGQKNATEERQVAAPKAEVGAEVGAGAGAGAEAEAAVETARAPAEKQPPRKTPRGKGKVSAAAAGDDKAEAALRQATAVPQRKTGSITALRTARRRSPRGRPPREESAETPSASNASNGGGSGSGGDGGGGGGEMTSARPPLESEMEARVDDGVADTEIETGAEPEKREGRAAGVGGAGSVVSSTGPRERWVHVDPVLGAADQPEKVSAGRGGVEGKRAGGGGGVLRSLSPVLEISLRIAMNGGIKSRRLCRGRRGSCSQFWEDTSRTLVSFCNSKKCDVSLKRTREPPPTPPSPPPP